MLNPEAIHGKNGEKAVEQNRIGHAPLPAKKAEQSAQHGDQVDKVHHLIVGMAGAQQDVMKMIASWMTRTPTLEHAAQHQAHGIPKRIAKNDAAGGMIVPV
jgi:hypothetical protein